MFKPENICLNFHIGEPPSRMYGGELPPNAMHVNEQLVIFYMFAIRRGKSGC